MRSWRHARRIYITITIGCMSATSLAQVARDAIQVGGRWFLRSQTQVDAYSGNFYETHVVADERGAVVTLRQNPGVVSYHCAVDSWGRRIYEPRTFDPTSVNQLTPVVAGDHVWFIYNDPAVNITWAEVHDREGQVVMPRLSIETGNSYPDAAKCIRAKARNGSIAVVLAPAGPPQGTTQLDLYLYVFTTIGELIEGPIPIATSAISEEEPNITYFDDESIGIAYIRGRFDPPPTIASYRRVLSDFSLLPESPLSEIAAAWVKIDNLPQDRFVAILYGLGTGNIWRQEHTLNGDLAVGPILLEDERRVFAATNASGESILGATPIDDTMWVRLYDDNGQPLDERRDFAMPGSPPWRVVFAGQAVAYADDGTAWILWLGDGPTQEDDAFLTSLRPFLPGDMNRDGLVNNFDIDQFVFALSNLPAYAATYNIPEDAAVIIGDVNEDGVLNNFDIDPFVLLLAGE